MHSCGNRNRDRVSPGWEFCCNSNTVTGRPSFSPPMTVAHGKGKPSLDELSDKAVPCWRMCAFKCPIVKPNVLESSQRGWGNSSPSSFSPLPLNTEGPLRDHDSPQCFRIPISMRLIRFESYLSQWPPPAQLSWALGTEKFP